MAVLKKKIKTTLGLISTIILLFGAALGISVRESNPKINPNQTLNQESQDYSLKSQQIEETRLVCRELLEETLEKDENTLVFKEYTNIKPAECIYVGCGGIF